MVLIPVHCPHCDSDQVVKRGKSSEGKQRYLCQNEACSHQTFILEYSYRGRVPEVKQQIVDMALNGSGIRDTAQKIERKHLMLRTRIKRLARKTICFSKSTQLHNIVIGLFINRYEFGVPV